MTTPDKEEMPTDMTAAKLIRWPDTANIGVTEANGDIVWWAQISTLNPNTSVADLRNVADRIVTACNAYEPTREALEKVMVGGNHLGLIIGVDHPPYTASHEEARVHYADAIWTYEAWCCWKTIMEVRPALSTLPVNDRHHSGSDSYQADAGAPALSEKVNVRSEWLPIEKAPKDGTRVLIFRKNRVAIGAFDDDKYLKRPVPFWDGTDAATWGKAWAKSNAPTHWMPLPSPPGAELNFSNDAERDGGENA